jgi:hypothetical protein
MDGLEGYREFWWEGSSCTKILLDSLRWATALDGLAGANFWVQGE